MAVAVVVAVIMVVPVVVAVVMMVPMAVAVVVVMMMPVVMVMLVSAFRFSRPAYFDWIVLSASAGITHGLLVLFNKQ